MKNLLTAMLFLVLGHKAAAETQNCIPNKSLVEFYSHGVAMKSTQIGEEGVCVDFGGNQVFTPRFKVSFYVNFNIKAKIDLDKVDEAIASGLMFQNASDAQRLSKIKLVVVRAGWIEETYGTDSKAVSNLNGEIVFISEEILQSGNLEEIIKNIYSYRKDRQEV